MTSGELQRSLRGSLTAAEVVVFGVADLQQSLGGDPIRILAWLQWALPATVIVELHTDGGSVALWRNRRVWDAGQAVHRAGVGNPSGKGA